ncbi:MAG: dihydrodipicolinate synthase family protein [Candidatus Latescibacteria bacterium]|nr:dihydrodipicolinate synthase family protein [Candidatus Latescibacterota bacterium]
MTDVTTRYPQSLLAACLIPWTESYEFDVPVFESHVNKVIDLGYTNLYIMGTAAEGYAITDTRFKQVVESFASLIDRKGLSAQVGVISLSMEQVIERIGFAYDQGIRFFQVSLPSWGALDEGETLVFFETVCGAFPDSRFLHYNLPRAGRIVDGNEYRAIADAVPNLVATKNSTSDYARTADLMKHSPDLQHFFLENNWALGCTLGECSFLTSLGLLFPNTARALYDSGRSGDLNKAFAITERLRTVVPTLFGHCSRKMIDGSYDKTFAWLKDPKFSYRLLPPYQGLNDEEAAECRRRFDANYSDLS